MPTVLMASDDGVVVVVVVVVVAVVVCSCEIGFHVPYANSFFGGHHVGTNNVTLH